MGEFIYNIFKKINFDNKLFANELRKDIRLSHIKTEDKEELIILYIKYNTLNNSSTI